MIITSHGKKDLLFKGAAKHNGIKLVFFGWSPEHVQGKEQEWLLKHMPLSQPRERKRPTLKLVSKRA